MIALPVYLVFPIARGGVRDPIQNLQRICALESGLAPLIGLSLTHGTTERNVGCKLILTLLPGVFAVLLLGVPWVFLC